MDLRRERLSVRTACLTTYGKSPPIMPCGRFCTTALPVKFPTSPVSTSSGGGNTARRVSILMKHESWRSPVELTSPKSGMGRVSSSKRRRLFASKVRSLEIWTILKSTEELVDVLHHVLLLWETSQRDEMLRVLSQSGYGDSDAFYRVAQAISETLPIESREKKLLDGFLAGRERVRGEMRQGRFL